MLQKIIRMEQKYEDKNKECFFVIKLIHASFPPLLKYSALYYSVPSFGTHANIIKGFLTLKLYKNNISYKK